MKILGIQKDVSVPPTSSEMKSFYDQFEKDAWIHCCKDQIFLDLVSENLQKASARAVMLLSQIKENNENKI